MDSKINPTKKEVKDWLLSTLRHSIHVEYFLDRLGLGAKDPERPHDLIGPGNKFDWEVVKGMALLYRQPKVDFKTYILPAITIHRQQYHHRKWNDPDPQDATKPLLGSTEEDMLVGAVDAACSLLESRIYSGGEEQNEHFGREHSWDETQDVLYNKNPPHKVPWAKMIVPKMRRVERPCLELIADFQEFPNLGLPLSIYDAIRERTKETADSFRERDFI